VGGGGIGTGRGAEQEIVLTRPSRALLLVMSRRAERQPPARHFFL
jgi:hypothetical protein